MCTQEQLRKYWPVKAGHIFRGITWTIRNLLRQLDVIERAMQMWSMPGDVVFTPFLGIGSEAYVAVSMGRKAIGVELKSSYFKLAVRNIEQAERQQYDLFGG